VHTISMGSVRHTCEPLHFFHARECLHIGSISLLLYRWVATYKGFRLVVFLYLYKLFYLSRQIFRCSTTPHYNRSMNSSISYINRIRKAIRSDWHRFKGQKKYMSKICYLWLSSTVGQVQTSKSRPVIWSSDMEAEDRQGSWFF
jgi:hypothetical protein